MQKFEHAVLTHQEAYEYAFSPVPAEKRKPVGLLMMVLIGFSLSTSGVKVGIQAGNSMTFWEALGACIAGNLVLFFIALFWGILGQQSGNTSGVEIKRLLGTPVSLLFSVFVFLAMIGWMGMNGEWLAAILTNLFPNWNLPIPVAAILFITLGMVISLRGWKSIELLDKLLVPAILLLGIYIAIRTKDMGMELDLLAQRQAETGHSVSVIVAVVIGNYAMSAATMPDLCRFAKSRRAVLGCAAAYAITLTLCNLCGILIVQGTGAQSLTYGVYLLGVTIPGLVCLAICTYTTQNVNAYVGSLALQNILKRTPMGGEISYQMALLFMSGFAMIGGVLGIGSYLSVFARFLAVGSVSLTGIAVIETLMGRKLSKVKNGVPLIAWLFSMAVSLAVWICNEAGTFMIPVTLVSASGCYLVLRGKDWLAAKNCQDS